MNRRIVLLLLAAITAGVLLRLIPNWQYIFADGYINLDGVDSYWHIKVISDVIQSGAYDGLRIYDLLVAWIVEAVSFGNPSIHVLELVSVYLPLFLATLTIIMVYVIGRCIYGNKAGIIAAFIVALLPGENLGRSMLGCLDHHAFEVFITTVTIMLLVLAGKDRSKYRWQTYSYIIVAGCCFYAYMYSWPGYIMMLPVIAAFAVMVHKKAYVAVGAMGILYIVLYGINISGMPELTMATTEEAFPGYTSYIILMHIIALAVMMFAKYDSKYRWPMIIWGVTMVCLTIWQRRFDYYLIIPLALMAGYALSQIKGSKALALTATAVFILACLPAYIMADEPDVPSREWHETLEWVKENTSENITIVAWWPYGYWIEYYADREAYVNPGQAETKCRRVARYFNATKEYIPCWFKEKDIYVLVGRQDMERYYASIAVWDGGVKNETPLIEQLSAGESVDDYELVKNSHVRVYRYAGD